MCRREASFYWSLSTQDVTKVLACDMSLGDWAKTENAFGEVGENKVMQKHMGDRKLSVNDLVK